MLQEIEHAHCRFACLKRFMVLLDEEALQGHEETDLQKYHAMAAGDQD